MSIVKIKITVKNHIKSINNIIYKLEVMNLIATLKLIFLIFLGVLIAYVNYFTTYFSDYNQFLTKVLHSIVILSIFYIANILLDNLLMKRIKEKRERYTLRKAISTIFSILGLGALLSVWIQETTTLVVAYGLLSAGIAIALQDVLRNIAGGIIVFFSSPFKAGDRIKVDNDMGDVIDIKLFYTTLMEIQEWIDGDQYTGRMTHIPNSFVLNKTVKNYTKDFSFIWDEIHIMITYDSNLKKAKEIAIGIAHEVADPFRISATNELSDLGEKYLITPGDVDEQIYIKITDNWVDMRLRYVVDPRQRRAVKHSLFEKLLETFNQESDIKIASATFEIVGFPAIRIEK